MRRPVHVSNREKALHAPAAAIRRIIHTLDASGLFEAPEGELSIALLPHRAMCELHARFLDDPSPTDVITFEGDPLAATAGEICVCPAVAREFVEKRGGDFAAELTLYIVHGYLHLAGFDDTTPDLKRAMRAAERRAMRCLAAAGVEPDFHYKPAGSHA
ncbi:MAG: rRNA maturation RNase YbeY [Verrucomicrobia bacterium]|nr:MAG: rRNA maturation RNase YbeY [Verrucomicrobiota bacterium]